MGRQWIVLAALTFARAAMGYQFQSIAAVAPMLEPALGLDKTQLGWLIGLYLLPGIAIALPGGMLGARFGDKRLVLAGLALMTFGGAWLALARSVVEADAARVVCGAGAVVLNVLLTKLVADWFAGRERVLAMSILVNAWPIGIGLALLVVGPVAVAAGWQWALGTSAVFAAAGFAVVLVVYCPPPGLGAAVQSTSVGLGLLQRREWLLLLAASAPWLLYNAAYQIAISFLPSYLVETGSGLGRAGAWSALNTVVLVVSVQLGGIVLKRTRRFDLVCHLAICGWCATLLGLTTGTVPLFWIVAAGLIAGLPASGFVSLPAEILRPESRGAGMGVFYTIYYLGCAVLPPVAGLLYDATGSARPTLWFAAGVAFACVPALFAFRRLARGGDGRIAAAVR
jgi:MFS family permease